MRGFILLFFISLSLPLSGQSIFDQFEVFFDAHTAQGLVDYQAIQAAPDQMNKLEEQIAAIDFESESIAYQKAFLINAYNFFVIAKLAKAYPVTSPKSISSFFLKKDLSFFDKKYSLDQLENSLLFGIERDPRFHLALICGAKSCPPFPSSTLRPATLDTQLDDISQRAINDMAWLTETEENIFVSQIFNWYGYDFGDLHSFLKKYRPAISSTKSFKFLDYDWAINDIKNQASGAGRAAFMTPSQLLGAGTWEFKAFQSAYVQKNKDGFEDFSTRSIYFSSFNQFNYGINPNVNIGLDVVWKRNKLNFPIVDNMLDTIRHADGSAIFKTLDHGLSHLAPKFKFKPFSNIPRLTFQESLYIPIDKSVDGQWISHTQFFYDRNLGPRSSLFLELSFWTPIAPSFKFYPFLKSFWSIFPNRYLSFYAMLSLPGEYGAGGKINITRRLELEMLFTRYVNVERFFGDRSAQTFNIGVRIHP